MTRKQKIITGLCSLIILDGGVLYVHGLVAGPAAGIVQTSDTKNTAIVAPAIDMSPVAVSGKYASFTIPKALQPLTTDAPNAPVLENYAYGYKDTGSWKLSITVSDIAGSSSGEDSSYMLRASKPAQYQLTSAIIGGKNVRIMTDLEGGGFSKVAYIKNGTYEADISLYGYSTAGTENLAKTFDTVLRSWQWKQ